MGSVAQELLEPRLRLRDRVRSRDRDRVEAVFARDPRQLLLEACLVAQKSRFA
jgi:hypothetical protein